MYHKLKSSHEKIREKHQALSQQYQDKQNELALTHRECAQEIRRYQSAFTSIEALILSTAQTTASNRLSTMTTYFEKIKNSLWDVEGDSDKR